MLEECEGKCMKCGALPDFRGLSLHHLVFRSQGGEGIKENLILVCGRCHSQFHGINEKG